MTGKIDIIMQIDDKKYALGSHFGNFSQFSSAFGALHIAARKHVIKQLHLKRRTNAKSDSLRKQVISKS